MNKIKKEIADIIKTYFSNLPITPQEIEVLIEMTVPNDVGLFDERTYKIEILLIWKDFIKAKHVNVIFYCAENLTGTEAFKHIVISNVWWLLTQHELIKTTCKLKLKENGNKQRTI